MLNELRAPHVGGGRVRRLAVARNGLWRGVHAVVVVDTAVGAGQVVDAHRNWFLYITNIVFLIS